MKPTIQQIHDLFEQLAKDHKAIEHDLASTRKAFFGFDPKEIMGEDINPNIHFPCISLSTGGYGKIGSSYTISDVGNIDKVTTIVVFIYAYTKGQTHSQLTADLSTAQDIADDIVIRLRQLQKEGQATCEWYSSMMLKNCTSFRFGPEGPLGINGIGLSIPFTAKTSIPLTKNTLVWH